MLFTDLDALSRNHCKACSRQESASANSDSEDEIPEKYNDCSNVRAITRSKDSKKNPKNHFVLCGWDILNIRLHLSSFMTYQGLIQRGRTPPKIGKNIIFLRKIVIFYTKYPKNFRASLRNWKK